MKKTRFVSVGRTIAIKSSLITLMFGLIVTPLFRDYIYDRAQYDIVAKGERDFSQFSQIKLTNFNMLLGYLENFSFDLSTRDGLTLDSMDSSLSDKWAVVSLINGIESIELYNSLSQFTHQYGDPSGTLPEGFIRDVIAQGKPKEIFLCDESCEYIVAAPLISENGEIIAMSMALSADVILDSFSLVSDSVGAFASVDAAMGNLVSTYASFSPRLRDVDFNYYTSVYNAKTKPSKSDDMRVEKVGDRQLSFNVVSLSDQESLGMHLFWFSDVTSIINERDKSLEQIIIMMVVTCVALFFIIAILHRGFSRKAKVVANALPLLVESEFDEAEAIWSRYSHKGRFEDEMDVLINTGRKVTQQLKRLNIQVEEQSQRLHVMAYRDVLTGLGNRQSFYEGLDQKMRELSRRDVYLGLLFMDIDGFKPVNDTFGHNAGDFLLKVLAERVSECIRRADTLYRLAGDEFVILADDLTSEQGLQMLAEKVISVMAQTILWEGNPLNISLSIGGVVTKNSNLERDYFLHVADEAMYISKNTGKGKYTFHGIV